MRNFIRPGDTLADRYRLVDLLNESGGGRFWRAHDKVLERHVALHVIPADDERAAGLLEAARQSATVHDRRVLRVLDADRTDEVCYVVNEWGSGASLDIMLATEGPLSPRRAAWLVSEVGACLAVAHADGVAHGRLVPENVLIDGSGSVRLIGFSVDAALHGLPAGRVSTDVADLASLLYCALTGKWPGVSRSTVPPAPQEHGRVLRPRQVRAGVPRPLDTLCDEVINAYAASPGTHGRGGHDLSTAQGISDALAAFVGDPTGLAEAEAHAAARASERTVVLPPGTHAPPRPRPGSGEVALPAPETPSTDAPATAGATPTEVFAIPDAAGQPNGLPTQPPAQATQAPTEEPAVRESGQATEQPTQAGLPIFDDDNDDVSWFTARAEKAAPPPPFEEPPERPLFAPDPTDGRPARSPRPGSTATNGGRDFWPWDTGTGTGVGASVADDDEDDDEMPGRSWLRLAAVVAASALLLLAIVFAFNLGRGRSPLGAVPEEKKSPSAGSDATAAAGTIAGVKANDFDPQGDPPEENPDLAPLSVDGNPSTAWRTMTYSQNLGPGGLKTGVGLTLDLGSTHDVSAVDLTMVGAPTDVNLYVTDTVPTAVRDLTPAATATVQARKQTVTFDAPVSGRYVTVWLTSLPQVAGGYRGEVAEVAVHG